MCVRIPIKKASGVLGGPGFYVNPAEYRSPAMQVAIYLNKLRNIMNFRWIRKFI